MSLEEIAREILFSEEAARELARRLKGKTAIKVLSNVPIPVDLLDVKGGGTLEEILVRAPDFNYGITFTVDGASYTLSWTTVNSTRAEVSTATAFKDEDGLYILYVSGISFSNSLKVTIAGATMTLNTVFYKLTTS